MERYQQSSTFRRIDPLTQKERRSVFRRTTADHGSKPFGFLESRHVVMLRDVLDGNPANRRVKCLRYLFTWAVEAGHA